jgi:hypothetical protein
VPAMADAYRVMYQALTGAPGTDGRRRQSPAA